MSKIIVWGATLLASLFLWGVIIVVAAMIVRMF